MRPTLKRLLRYCAATLLLVLPALAILPGTAPSLAQAATAPASAEDLAHVIVRYKNGSAELQAWRSLREQHAQRLGRRLGLGLSNGRALGRHMQVLHAKGMSSQALAAQLSAQPEVEWAVVDGRKTAMATANDPLLSDNQVGTTPTVGQWYLRAPDSSVVSAINAVGAWSISAGSSGVTVAVLDTGVRFDHPDFKNADGSSKLYPGYDFVSSTTASNDGNGRDADASDPGDPCTTGPNPTPSSWHGTQTAGIVGAATNNGVGMAGVGYNTMVLPLRVLGECGGSDSDIIAAMYYAANQANGDAMSVLPGDPSTNPHPAQVVSLSLGSSGACNVAYQRVVNDLNAGNVSVVVSAGNSNGLAVATPANCAGVIAVAALRHVGTKVGFSSLGPQVSISAPGGNCINITAGSPCLYPILTTSNDGVGAPGRNIYTDSFDPSLGTSFSAPQVAGTIGLMLAVNPTLTPAQVIATLKHSARPFPTSGGSATASACTAPSVAGAVQDECYCNTSTCGAGMLDAAAAVARAAGLATLPTAVVSPSSASIIVGSSLSLSAAGASASTGRSLVAYDWRITQGAGLASFSAATDTLSTAITGNSAGTVTVKLTVTDSTGASDSSFATVQVLAIAPPSVAIAGVPGSLTVGSAVTLTGVATANGGRSISAYQWTISSGADLATLQNASTSAVTLNATAPGVVTLQLQATDSAGAVGTSSVTLNLVAAPVGGGGGGSGAMSAAWLAALAVAALALAWPRPRRASARGRH